MTNVYKFEVVVIDYDDLGELGITRLIEGLRTPYTVLSYVTDTQKASVDDPDTLGRRQLVEQKIPQLFSPWLPITTAPRDGTRFVLWYAKEKRQYVVYFEEYYEYVGSHKWELVETYFVVDSPHNHTDRYYIEESRLIDSYWQPLQTPPQL